MRQRTILDNEYDEPVELVSTPPLPVPVGRRKLTEQPEEAATEFAARRTFFLRLAPLLIRARSRRGLTRKQLSERTGLSQRIIHFAESGQPDGRRQLAGSTIERLLTGCGDALVVSLVSDGDSSAEIGRYLVEEKAELERRIVELTQKVGELKSQLMASMSTQKRPDMPKMSQYHRK